MKGKKEIPFIKMHGIGNDYIYIDALKGETPSYLKEEKIPDLAKKISDRHFGIGSDGLILILPSVNADFRMRIFNADGSEAKMCGNGVRCVGKYLYDLGFTKKDKLAIETESGIKKLNLTINNNEVESVEVEMGSPFFTRGAIQANGNEQDLMEDISLNASGKEFKITGVSMGNPHGVVFVKDVDVLDLSEIGPALENNSIWKDRANIEFVEVLSPKELKMRVWERGSGETLACGTGACASAVVSNRKGFTMPEVKVNLKGGSLNIKYDSLNERVVMEGPAKFIGKGVFYNDFNETAI